MDQDQGHISMLHVEILCHIFELNADMDLEQGENWHSSAKSDRYGQAPSNLRALNVIRYTSQVCQHWRDLILGSPSIWGKLIDLHLLSQESGLWRNEVTRRAGESSRLCIIGLVSGRALNAFFVDLMKNHWSRIRRLDVAVRNYELLDGEVWTVLQRPAPHLEFFQMDIEDWRNRQLFPTTNPPLFSDTAPSLREFHFTYNHYTNHNFTLHAPWLRQLRGFTFSASFSMSDILDVLTNIPFLESVELQNSVVDTPAMRRRIDLPRLSVIKMKGTQLRAALSVLESVAAAPGCALIINTIDTRSANVKIEDIQALQKMISDYASAYLLNSRTINGFTLCLSHGAFSFWVPLANGPPNPTPPLFCIELFCRFGFPSGSINTLLNSFSSCQFNNITTLDIRPGGYRPLKEKIDNLKDLASFSSLFPSVEILYVPEYSLLVLSAILECHPRVFPLLHTLKIQTPMPETRFYVEDYLEFLDQREKDKLPIKVLDITGLWRQPRYWGPLERIVGLKVMWAKDEVICDYICGSGEPEKLNLLPKEYFILNATQY